MREKGMKPDRARGAVSPETDMRNIFTSPRSTLGLPVRGVLSWTEMPGPW